MVLDAPVVMLLGHLVGFFFSVVVGAWMVGATVRAMRTSLGVAPVPFAWQSNAVGLLERALYTSAWLVGRPGFVAIWLGLKLAGHWKHGMSGGEAVPGKAAFGVFLIGNGLSLAYGLLGGMMVDWLRFELWPYAIAAPIVLVLFNWYLMPLVPPAGPPAELEE